MNPDEVSIEIEDFLEKHPDIQEALRIFSISLEEYWKSFPQSRVISMDTTDSY
jgi:hypothetical protein